MVISIDVQRLQAPLAGDLEPADRLDLVAEELDPHRLVPVGGEDVEDAAAAGELAGQFDRAGVVEAALDQPPQQGRPRRRVPPTCNAAAAGRQQARGWASAAAGSGCWSRSAGDAAAAWPPVASSNASACAAGRRRFRRAGCRSPGSASQAGNRSGATSENSASRRRTRRRRPGAGRRPPASRPGVRAGRRRPARARRAPHAVPRHILAARQRGHGSHEAWVRSQASGEFADFARRHGCGRCVGHDRWGNCSGHVPADIAVIDPQSAGQYRIVHRLPAVVCHGCVIRAGRRWLETGG